MPEKIIPILVYEDIQRAHDFLVEAFGFSSGGVQAMPTGEVVHAEVRAKDFVIWLHRPSPEHNLVSPRELPNASAGLVVYVDDVDAHWRLAQARGAQIDSAPQDQPYDQREYGARDCEGHRWWFATPLSR